MIEVEFLRDYGCCWKKGDRRKVREHFAFVLLNQKIAKRLDGPPKHKMMESPQKAKGHNIPYYKG